MIRSLLSAAFPLVILFTGNACAAFPSKSQEFVVSNGPEPQSIDPAKIASTHEARIFSALFEGLTVHDPRTGKGALNGLAESYKVSDDGRTFTIRLRRAEWSDGTPITAQTIYDSWMRVLDPKTGSSSAQMVCDEIEGAKAYVRGLGRKEDVKIKVVDALTFQVTFVGPMPYVLDMLAHHAYAVFPMHAIAKHGIHWTQPANFVGNGPFLLREWKPGDRILVVKNNRYWDARNVQLERITFLSHEGDPAIYDKYKAGEIDWIKPAGRSHFNEINRRKDYHQVPSATVYYFTFNVRRKPFDDVRVRKALSMAIDRKVLCEKILNGGRVPTGGLVPGFDTYVTTKGNAFNPEQAKRLLAAAGYQGGKAFPKCTVIYSDPSFSKPIAEWVRQQWKSILDLDVELRSMDWGRFMDTRRMHDFTICLGGWSADYPDPSNFLDELLKTGGGNNDGQFSNPEADTLLEQAARMPAGETRTKTLMMSESILITEDQAVIPLFFNANQDLIDLGKWGGWHANPMGLHPWKTIHRK